MSRPSPAPRSSGIELPIRSCATYVPGRLTPRRIRIAPPTKGPLMQDKLIIFDTTLRDGEQAPGIALSPDDKLVIAKQLAKLRVDVIEAGFAASSPGDYEAVARIAREVQGPVIASLARTHPDDIERAADALEGAARKRVHVFVSTSPIHMEQMLRMTPDEVLRSVTTAWRGRPGGSTMWSSRPRTRRRSDPDFVIEVCRRQWRPAQRRSTSPTRLATPCRKTSSPSVKGLRRGQAGQRGRDHLDALSQRSGTCRRQLAVGDPCGSAPDRGSHQRHRRACRQHFDRRGDHGVSTRQDYFDVEIGADTTEIVETSRLVSSLTGYPIQYNKAVVGRNAFAHESGIHQHGVLRHRETYEIMDPAAIGHQSVIVLGKHSGRAAFADALDRMGLKLEDQDFQRAFDRFKELADRKGEIGEEGLRAIVQ